MMKTFLEVMLPEKQGSGAVSLRKWSLLLHRASAVRVNLFVASTALRMLLVGVRITFLYQKQTVQQIERSQGREYEHDDEYT